MLENLVNSLPGVYSRRKHTIESITNQGTELTVMRSRLLPIFQGLHRGTRVDCSAGPDTHPDPYEYAIAPYTYTAQDSSIKEGTADMIRGILPRAAPDRNSFYMTDREHELRISSRPQISPGQ